MLIRRPRQTQGGARQGIILLTLVSDYYYYYFIFMAAARGKRSQKHHFLWVSEVTLGIFGVQFWGFSVLQRHGVSPPGGDFFHGVFLFGDRKLKFMAAARGKRSQKHHYLWVSEVTLGIFGVQSWSFSVLQRHGVSPPGGDFFHCVFLFGDRM